MYCLMTSIHPICCTSDIYISHTWCLTCCYSCTMLGAQKQKSLRSIHGEVTTYSYQRIAHTNYRRAYTIHHSYTPPTKPPPSPLTHDPACCSRAHRGRGQYRSCSCVSLRFIPTGLNTMFIILFGCRLIYRSSIACMHCYTDAVQT